MRIIGGKDFYDGGLMYGRDEDVVFVRHKNKTMSNKEVPFVNYAQFSNRYGYTKFDAELYIFYAAGVKYPMVRVTPKHIDDGQGVRYFWKRDDYAAFCAKHNEQPQAFSYWHLNRDNQFKPWEAKITPYETDWLISNHITILHSQKYWDGGKEATCWTVDPFDLNRFEMQKHVNPFDMFQQISAWVGGVLPRNPNPMVEITDDKIKAAKHGMDRWSFRKMGVNSK